MFFRSSPKKRIYLDHAAATTLFPEVKKVMVEVLNNSHANPSAIHQEGVVARALVENSRQQVATALGLRPEGIIFTGSGTESNNLAILGLVEKLYKDGRPYSQMEIVTTPIEHPSISELLPILEKKGVVVRLVSVDSEGKIPVPALEAVLNKKTVLVTFVYANSEVGVVQNVTRLVRSVRQFEKEQGLKIFVHLDSAQAPLWLPCSLSQLGVDLMSLDTGKCHGPKGIGILALRGNVPLSPILFGGGQEQGLRAGTENILGIVGAAKALELAQATYLKRAESVAKVRDRFITALVKAIPEAKLNGPKEENRLANNINISLPKTDTEYLVIYLDKHHVSASTKSACAGAGSLESKVVLAMTKDSERAKTTLRLSLGEETTDADMKYVLEILLKYQAKMLQLTK
jgi:cysteine desulfurase